MSPWTALLESLHSALIDELTDRHPEPKPVLGMPMRQAALALPEPGLAESLACEASFVSEEGEKAQTLGSARGIVLLAMNSEARKRLKLRPAELWSALVKRAGTEFGFRKIRPRFTDPVPLPESGLPKGFGEPKRIVWIPIRIASGACWLGMGV